MFLAAYERFDYKTARCKTNKKTILIIQKFIGRQKMIEYPTFIHAWNLH
jgi:hypothetical protein